jgi:hypothetical protein
MPQHIMRDLALSAWSCFVPERWEKIQALFIDNRCVTAYDRESLGLRYEYECSVRVEAIAIDIHDGEKVYLIFLATVRQRKDGDRIATDIYAVDPKLTAISPVFNSEIQKEFHYKFTGAQGV